MDYLNILGWVAAAGTTLSSIPQSIETLRSRKTDGISLLMYLLFVFGVACWAVYGGILQNWQLLASNVITLIFSSITLGFKIHNVITHQEPFFSGKKKPNEASDKTHSS
jgi:MtN3 and saliva related transmembrane protein